MSERRSRSMPGRLDQDSIFEPRYQGESPTSRGNNLRIKAIHKENYVLDGVEDEPADGRRAQDAPDDVEEEPTDSRRTQDVPDDVEEESSHRRLYNSIKRAAYNTRRHAIRFTDNRETAKENLKNKTQCVDEDSNTYTVINQQLERLVSAIVRPKAAHVAVGICGLTIVLLLILMVDGLSIKESPAVYVLAICGVFLVSFGAIRLVSAVRRNRLLSTLYSVHQNDRHKWRAHLLEQLTGIQLNTSSYT